VDGLSVRPGMGGRLPASSLLFPTGCREPKQTRQFYRHQAAGKSPNRLDFAGLRVWPRTLMKMDGLESPVETPRS